MSDVLTLYDTGSPAMTEKTEGLFSLLDLVPVWIRSLALTLLTIPITLAIAAAVLNVNLGTFLDRYLEVIVARQERAADSAADKVIASVDGRLVSIERRLANQRDAAIAKERWYMMLSDRSVEQEARLNRLETTVCRSIPCIDAPIP